MLKVKEFESLTIFGLKGGLILLSSRSLHLTSLKKGWCLIASSPPWFCNIKMNQKQLLNFHILP